MSSQSEQNHRAPVEVTEDELQINSSTLYEQNNSSEEELEVIINGNQVATTPDEFSDTGDEEGVVYEIKAMDEDQVVNQRAMNATAGDQLVTSTTVANDTEQEAEDEEEDPPRIASADAEAVTFRRPSTAEKRKRPIDRDEEVCIKITKNKSHPLIGMGLVSESQWAQYT